MDRVVASERAKKARPSRDESLSMMPSRVIRRTKELVRKVRIGGKRRKKEGKFLVPKSSAYPSVVVTNIFTCIRDEGYIWHSGRKSPQSPLLLLLLIPSSSPRPPPLTASLLFIGKQGKQSCQEDESRVFVASPFSFSQTTSVYRKREKGGEKGRQEGLSSFLDSGESYCCLP